MPTEKEYMLKQNDAETTYQKKLTAGSNITIDPVTNTISSTGGNTVSSTEAYQYGDILNTLTIDGVNHYVKTPGLIAGPNVNITRNQETGALTISATGGGSSNVIPNPEGIPADVLETIGIGNIIYRIASIVELTEDEYEDLPSSKNTDDVMYLLLENEDIFNGGSTISLVNAVGITTEETSVNGGKGFVDAYESSAGYEGFNIALQNLTVGNTYKLEFDFQFTDAQFIGTTDYRCAYLISQSAKTDYSNYTSWTENLARDLLNHHHSVSFTATATTMHISFNLSGCSDDTDNYFIIDNMMCLDVAKTYKIMYNGNQYGGGSNTNITSGTTNPSEGEENDVYYKYSYTTERLEDEITLPTIPASTSTHVDIPNFNKYLNVKFMYHDIYSSMNTKILSIADLPETNNPTVDNVFDWNYAYYIACGKDSTGLWIKQGRDLLQKIYCQYDVYNYTVTDHYVKLNDTWVKIDTGGGAGAISDLTDVNLTDLSDGQVLKYNSTTEKWENADESGGSEVEANPSDPATDTLNTIGIDGTVYNIAGGGGGGSSSYEEEELYNATSSSFQNIVLKKSLLDYDIIVFYLDWDYTLTYDHLNTGFVYTKRELEKRAGSSTNKIIPMVDSSHISRYFLSSDGKTLTAETNNNDTNVRRIVGIKFGSGNGSAKVVTLFNTPTTTQAWANPVDVTFNTDDYDLVTVDVSSWDGNDEYHNLLTFELASCDIDDTKAFRVMFMSNEGAYLTKLSNGLRMRTTTGKKLTYNKVIGYKFGGGGNVDDVYVNGESVLDTNKIAQIKTHKEVSLAEYEDANDDIIYFVDDDDDELGIYYSPIIYSTEEREVGTWTNGKPLYEKTIYIGSMTKNSSWNQIAHNINDIEKVIKLCGQTKQSSDGRMYNIPHYRPYDNTGISIGADTTYVYYMNTWLEYASDTYVTIQYTKTTDAPGSAKYNALGVPMVHYSINEQVIGTWIDGKPIYRKIFTNLNITPSYNVWTVVDDIPANAEKYIGTDLIICEGANGNINLAHSGLEITFSNSDEKIKIEYNQNVNIRPVNILSILYTKTTD